MSSSSLKSLLSGAILLTAPVALANSTTTIPAFDAKIAAARGATSPGGTTVIRSEMSGALHTFIDSDDGVVDAAERAYLGTKVNDATFLTGVDASAKDFLNAFYEFNDAATTPSTLFLSWLWASPEDLYGAGGPLADASTILEGDISDDEPQGVVNQRTLLEALKTTREFGYGAPNSSFYPINPSELIATLSQSAGFNYETPSPEEVNGAAAFLTEISGDSNRLYQASWACFRGCQGDVGGYVIAAVNSDRRFVRVVKVITWVE
ncbi:hypothetical protein JY651_30500 [Pyxidicoccus parkwayensis]|uniref:DUF1566 domain-containing protein n=1 Tax=Pyxidicoccus parkwayensis TaxID=2813578 RepID=A0ABX7NPX8_9BACT|nr:hypothetical protein [Pyxidicoccus parkwaysis]QSQ19630.1 hypothetical protein JY651_30500 [Pyxidicoccus parkwaysis]